MISDDDSVQQHDCIGFMDVTVLVVGDVDGVVIELTHGDFFRIFRQH